MVLVLVWGFFSSAWLNFLLRFGVSCVWFGFGSVWVWFGPVWRGVLLLLLWIRFVSFRLSFSLSFRLVLVRFCVVLVFGFRFGFGFGTVRFGFVPLCVVCCSVLFHTSVYHD